MTRCQASWLHSDATNCWPPGSLWLPCVVSNRLTASRADLINVWCKPGSFLTTAQVLPSWVYGAHHSLRRDRGVGFQAGSLNQLGGKRRAEQSTLLSPHFHLRMGQTSCTKDSKERFYRGFPLRWTLWGKSWTQNGNVSQHSRGTRTDKIPEGPRLHFSVFENVKVEVLALLERFLLFVHPSVLSFKLSCIKTARWFVPSQINTVLSPQPVFLSLTLHPCGPECRTSPTNQVWPLTYKYAHIHSSWCGYKKMHQEEGRSKYRTWKRCQRALLLNLALTKQNMQMWVEAIRWWNHLIGYILTTAC